MSLQDMEGVDEDLHRNLAWTLYVFFSFFGFVLVAQVVD